MATCATSHVVEPPLNRHREDDSPYDMIVLKSISSYSYTIPSFYAISMKLRHVYARAEEDSGVNFYDIFLHEFPGCSSLQVSFPSIVCITNGCIVEVYMHNTA